MNIELSIFRLIYKPTTKWAARRALVGRYRSRHEPEKGRFTGADVNNLITQTWRTFDDLTPDVSKEPTLGSRMNVRLACVTISLYKVLMAAGISYEEAVQLIYELMWVIYARWGILPRLIAKLRTENPMEQMRICTNLFRRFPFNPPGYMMEDVPADDAVAINVLRCPTADYFRAQGLSKLGVDTWCQLDFSLAKTWGGRAERVGSLTAGDDRCAFRWFPGNEEPV